MRNRLIYIILIGAILIYSLTGVCTRYAAMYPFMSWQYVLFVLGVVGILGIYAILWQQIIQRIEISTAYMFRGLGLIFNLLFCYSLFSETITRNNIIGAIIIIVGITLFALSDKLDVRQTSDIKH